jgi:hypothetical protein
MPEKQKTISTKSRKATATIVQKIKGPRGGRTRYRFPMPDKAHARNALARLPQAKGLSAADRKKIKDRAYKMLYGTTDLKRIAEIKRKRR